MTQYFLNFLCSITDKEKLYCLKLMDMILSLLCVHLSNIHLNIHFLTDSHRLLINLVNKNVKRRPHFKKQNLSCTKCAAQIIEYTKRTLCFRNCSYSAMRLFRNLPLSVV